MSTEQKNCTPRLRFPGFEGEWDFVYGDELFESITNKKHNSDLPILALTQEQGAVPREMINYNVIVSDKSVAGYKVVEIDDFIISLRSFQGGIEYSRYRGLCSPAYIVLRKKSNELCSDFYRIYFKSFNYIQELNKNLEGIRDGKMISYKQFSEIKIARPNPVEQQKIAECLSSLDELITAQGEKVDALKEKKRGLMQQLFPQEGETTPRLRFPGFEGEWDERKIGESFNERSERNRGDLPLLSLGEKGLVYYCETDKKDNSNKDKSKYLRVAPGDVAYNTMRMWQGRCVCASIEGIVSPAYTVCKPKNGVNSLFHYYLFKTYRMIKTFHQNSQGLVSDTLNLKFNAFSKIKYHIPSPDEQKIIAECLEAIDKLIVVQEEKLDALKDHKRGLMQQLFPQPNE